MTMPSLTQAQAWLCCALMENPTLALVSAAAWLDPLQFVGDADWIDDDFTDDGHILWAARMCRENFPEIYARVLHAAETDAKRLDKLLLDALVEMLPQQLQGNVFDLEELRDRPPIVCFGFNLEDSEFYERHDNFQRLAGLFGLHSEGDCRNLPTAQAVASGLIKSLKKTRRKRYRDLALTLRWLFSMTGGTLLDMTNEDLYESGIEWPSWDELEYLKESYQEVRAFQDSARRAFKALKTNKA